MGQRTRPNQVHAYCMDPMRPLRSAANQSEVNCILLASLNPSPMHSFPHQQLQFRESVAISEAKTAAENTPGFLQWKREWWNQRLVELDTYEAQQRTALAQALAVSWRQLLCGCTEIDEELCRDYLCAVSHGERASAMLPFVLPEEAWERRAIASQEAAAWHTIEAATMERVIRKVLRIQKFVRRCLAHWALERKKRLQELEESKVSAICVVDCVVID